jgi:hypothetical protein
MLEFDIINLQPWQHVLLRLRNDGPNTAAIDTIRTTSSPSTDITRQLERLVRIIAAPLRGILPDDRQALGRVRARRTELLEAAVHVAHGLGLLGCGVELLWRVERVDDPFEVGVALRGWAAAVALVVEDRGWGEQVDAAEGDDVGGLCSGRGHGGAEAGGDVVLLLCGC